jgi:hypothetical protein
MGIEHKDTWQRRFPAVLRAAEVNFSQWSAPGTPSKISGALQELGAALHEIIEAQIQQQQQQQPKEKPKA